jgi:hypothetical protein
MPEMRANERRARAEREQRMREESERAENERTERGEESSPPRRRESLCGQPLTHAITAHAEPLRDGQLSHARAMKNLSSASRAGSGEIDDSHQHQQRQSKPENERESHCTESERTEESSRLLMQSSLPAHEPFCEQITAFIRSDYERASSHNLSS